MNDNKNMVCDMETGICGPADESSDNSMLEMIDFNKPQKKVDLYYVTDPMCSHCWAIEPVFNKFMELYGDYVNVNKVMGGLLEEWHDGPIDPANGIYKPADVAPHWREVGEHSRMPIDGSVMIDDPVQSSFPASRVYKIIQKQDGDALATEYLRRTREAVFVFNKNISRDEVLVAIVNALGLQGESIVEKSAGAQNLLDEDFSLAGSLGARGFPTIVLVNEENQGAKIVGSRPLETYVDGLERILEEKVGPTAAPALSDVLEKKKVIFSKEIEELYGLEKSEVQAFIKSELDEEKFDQKEALGELYITLK